MLCFENPVDLDLMNHRVQSIASVKIVCCHNNIFVKVRGALTCVSFLLYIWQLNLKQTLSFTSHLYDKLVITLTVDMIVQWEPENKKIRFWRKNFTTCQI